MGVDLYLYKSRRQYVIFEKVIFIQALIDDISLPLLNVADASCIRSFIVVYPEFLARSRNAMKKRGDCKVHM